MKISNFILLIACALVSLTSRAQQVMQTIRLNNGQTIHYLVSEIDSMTFPSGNVTIHLSPELDQTLTISSIDSGYFEPNNRLHSCGVDYVHNQDLNYGTMTDQEGNQYKTITIGQKVWMAENLNTASYQNGDPIESGLWHYFNNDPANACPYGKLYSEAVTIDSRNVCPTGWHMPSYVEWQELALTADPSYVPSNPTNVAGAALKSTGTIENNNGLWLAPNEGATNAFGFSAVPSGYFFIPESTFYNLNSEAAYWVAGGARLSEHVFSYDTSIFPFGDVVDSYYYSIRCISDTLANGLLPGCMNPDACNYNALATVDDGNCHITGEACNDNLSGTTNDAWTSSCDCAGEAALGAPHTCGAPSIHNPDLTYGTMTDQEGNTYKTIEIGNQKWMAENLNTTTYRNGDAIEPTDFNYYYDNTDFACPYGALYNWYAINDYRHVCPTGWHEPSASEWGELINTADPASGGGVNPNTASIALRSAGTIEAGNGVWYEYFNIYSATNSTGFSAIAGGADVGGYWDYMGSYSIFWAHEVNPVAIDIDNTVTDAMLVPVDASILTNKFSARCINDTLNNGVISIPGCMSVGACNFNPNATIDDGSCFSVGESCSDGLGGTANDTYQPDCMCSGDTIITTSHSCGAEHLHNPDITYGSITDIEGNSYKTVVIGTQEWMAENLKTSAFNNGDPIELENNYDNWFAVNAPLHCDYFEYYTNTPDASLNCPFGKYYNRYAIMDSRSVCPTNWHVPSDDDWNTLINYLDPNANGGANPNAVGDALKAAGTMEVGNGYWHEPATEATNTSGFSAIAGYNSYIWSSSPSPFSTDYGTTRAFSSGSSSVFISDTNDPHQGASVRCVHD